MAKNTQLKRPNWIKVKMAPIDMFEDTLRIIKENEIYTVCEEALCPNIGECWRKQTATFLIMGNVCTRRCGFCNIKTGVPSSIDEQEPDRIAQAIKKLGTKYAVITSVTRDDLEDGGAGHFANVIKSIKKSEPDVRVEILTPDFGGNEKSIEVVVKAKPDVFGHNVEIVKRLHHKVKKLPSNYEISINFLKKIKKIDSELITKTGIMVGVGETQADVFEMLDDAMMAGVNIVTVGQYLTPSTSHYPIVKYVTLDEFDMYKKYGETKGLKVISGPLVRSSYKARDTFSSICNSS
jgi:lipoic acid synthetase